MNYDTITVDFDVTCESFTVEDLHGLEFSATYEAVANIENDYSGDHITPDGPPYVFANLCDIDEYDIRFQGSSLPDWLQEHLCVEFAAEIDDAFFTAIGGQAKLDQLAIEASQR